MTNCNCNQGRATIDKFNEVSARIGSHVMLVTPSAKKEDQGE